MTADTVLRGNPQNVAGARPRPLERLLFGTPANRRGERPALLTLLLATGVLYIWGLGASGWANSFYSAAVQAGSTSWKAFFFGSSDAANFITVDKPPASLWVMELSARMFGVNAWSILVPQAIEGVATVALLYATVRRWFTPAAGLIAGAVVALTPVAVLMFRFNNPDALLVLLLTAAAYAVTRALESASTRWLVLAGSSVGFGFLAKMMQAFLVVPAFGLVYLIAAPTPLRRRIVQLLLAGGAMFGAAAWWVVTVALTPAASRPYIGGSQHNSILELIFGYNGFGRLTGNETGSVTGGGGAAVGAGGSQWGATGLYRLFGADMGTQISWLIPAALILMVGALWWGRRAVRTDRLRAAAVLWGATLIVSGVTISLSKGIIHPYYTVALAPAIGALIGIGGTVLWTHRHQLVARLVVAAAIAVTAVWSSALLGRTPTFVPWLRWTVLVAGLVVAVAICVTSRAKRVFAAAVATGAIVTMLAGPAAYAVDTAATAHAGSIPSAGPATTGSGPGGFRGGPPNGFQGPPNAAGPQVAGATGAAGAAGAPIGGRGGPGGGPGGGLLSASAPTAALTATLKAGASSYTWVAAAIGSNTASGYQLAAGDPVMAIGGFNGSDPAPTLAEFQSYVSRHLIHYFIAGGVGSPNGGSNASSQISQWVTSNFTATTVGGVTLYDLTTG